MGFRTMKEKLEKKIFFAPLNDWFYRKNADHKIDLWQSG